MTFYEGIATFLALVAIVISVISYRRATTLSFASIELAIKEQITSTKTRVSDIGMQIYPLTAKEKRTPTDERHLEALKISLEAAIENNLNAYEEACAKYLDKKVDRKRFEKSYRVEIRQLVEDKNLGKRFDGVTSRYKAILKVYRMWEDLE